MGSNGGVEKTEEELRREIDELLRQQRQITERLRDPRGLRRGGLSAGGPRNSATIGGRHRGFVRPAERNEVEDQPQSKRRLLSAVVKVGDVEIAEDPGTGNDVNNKEVADDGSAGADKMNWSDRSQRPSNLQQGGWSRRDGNQRAMKKEVETLVTEHVPRVLPKNEDPSLVSRNRRMLGQLLGTLEKFRNEDMKLSGTEAYIQRSNALQRAEQRAREESERLRQQEREQIAEKRKRDLILKARIAAKAEEKRTKAEPPIYYLPKKPLDEDANLIEERREQAFSEWRDGRREELSEYQKQIAEQYLSNVEKELERWQNARQARRPNNDTSLQETMDKELDTHRLEHGPKTRKIPGGSNNEDEDDVEDIIAGEDDMMDDVLDVKDNSQRGDEAAKPEVGDATLPPENPDQE